MATLSYPTPHTFWQHFEFESTVTTALVVSLLTTLITYQIGAFCTDLTLGWKPRRTARVRTFHTVLLSRRFSPLAVLNALLRRDALTRIYFRRHLAANVADIGGIGNGIPRDDAPVKFAPAFFLVLLLLTPPVVSIFAIGVTIENERSLSFKEAGADGFFLGVSQDDQGNVIDVLKRTRLTEDCEWFPVKQLPYDVVTARLMMCAQTARPGSPDDKGKRGNIAVSLQANTIINVQIAIGSRFWDRLYSGFLRTGSEESLVLRAAIEKELAGKLAVRTMEKITEVCGGESRVDDIGLLWTLPEPQEDGEQDVELVFLVGTESVPCELESEKEELEKMREVFKVVDRIISIVQTDQLLVQKPTGSQDEVDFIDAGDEPFLRRRRRIMGIGVMAIAAAVVVMARVGVGMVANNDINDGIERMVKERLGLEYCESLLSDNVASTIVEYKLNGGSTDGQNNQNG